MTARIRSAIVGTAIAIFSFPAWAQPAAEPLAAPKPVPPAAASSSGATLQTAAEELGYALGYRIGGRILADHKDLDVDFDPAAMSKGLTDAVMAVEPRLTEAQFRRALASFEAAMQKRQEEFVARMAAAAKTNLARGGEFLAANATRKGVVTLPSGLQYEVLEEGRGPQPGPDDVVVAHYRGTHIDGREFDGTEPGGEPASFPLRGVVPGWQEALQRMKAGAKWRVCLPPDLAYGEEGSPPAIEPNEVLIFEIQLLRSQPAGPP
jgi:FKBP-type peptidyl-prolyl cis-trans isomerase FklB